MSSSAEQEPNIVDVDRFSCHDDGDNDRPPLGALTYSASEMDSSMGSISCDDFEYDDAMEMGKKKSTKKSPQHKLQSSATNTALTTSRSETGEVDAKDGQLEKISYAKCCFLKIMAMIFFVAIVVVIAILLEPVMLDDIED